MSFGFAVDLRTSRVQRLDGLGSSVMEWKPHEPPRLLKSSGFAVGLNVCEVESKGWGCISRSGLADLDL